jgi:hypothetical protein
VPIGKPIKTVADAIANLETELQDAYLAGAVTPRQGTGLLHTADMARNANLADDFVLAFSYIQQAHDRIEEIRASGAATLEEAYRIHRAFDLLGAMISTHPPQ